MNIKSMFIVCIYFVTLQACIDPQYRPKQKSSGKIDQNISIEDQSISKTKSLVSKTCHTQDLNISEILLTPKSIDHVVELINKLPRPLDIPCLLSVLKRPLQIVITKSRSSFQPALGPDNPRIFILNYPLVISISTLGPASFFVELSQYTDNTHSIKGEISFPIDKGLISSSLPYDRLDLGQATTCGGCHTYEKKFDSKTPGVKYESIAIKPIESSIVDIKIFKNEVHKCDFVDETDHRCELLKAVFNHGQVIQGQFPEETITFIQSFSF